MATVLAILSAVLILLKLFGYITLSWFWVLAPLFVPFCMVLFFVGTLLGLAELPDILSYRRKRK